MRVSFFDLECSNLVSDYGRIFCGCVMDLETKEVTSYRMDDYASYKKEPWNDTILCEDIRNHLEEYDIIVGWYSKMFDVRFLQGRLLINGSRELRKIKHIDLYYQARNRMKFARNRLESVSQLLKTKTTKSKLEPEYWIKAGAGHKDSVSYIVDHCERDVRVLSEIYERLAKFVDSITR